MLKVLSFTSVVRVEKKAQKNIYTVYIYFVLKVMRMSSALWAKSNFTFSILNIQNSIIFSLYLHSFTITCIVFNLKHALFRHCCLFGKQVNLTYIIIIKRRGWCGGNDHQSYFSKRLIYIFTK